MTHQLVLVQVQRWYVIAVDSLSPNNCSGAYLNFIYTLAIQAGVFCIPTNLFEKL